MCCTHSIVCHNSNGCRSVSAKSKSVHTNSESQKERETTSTRSAPILIQLPCLTTRVARAVANASAYGPNPIIVVDIDLIIYITSDACHEIITILAMSQLDSAGGPSATMELRECARALAHILCTIYNYICPWRSVGGG